jgi:hypothetical protein
MRNLFWKLTVLPAFAATALIAACEDDDDPTDPDETEFEATLTGAAERPDPVTTTATGSGTLEINDNNIEFSITVNGLSGAATMAHIHGPATTSESAPIVVTFTSLSTSVTGTLVSGSFSTTGNVAISLDSLKTMIRNGRAYFNVHTVANPAGEIRGQIVPQ